MIRELWSMRSCLCQLITSLVLILACGSAPAKAHPHVFVDVKVDLVFSDGKVTGIQHYWTFDDLYSAFVTQGVGRNPDAPTEAELLPIAKSNVEFCMNIFRILAAIRPNRPIRKNPPSDVRSRLVVYHICSLIKT